MNCYIENIEQSYKRVRSKFDLSLNGCKFEVESEQGRERKKQFREKEREREREGEKYERLVSVLNELKLHTKFMIFYIGTFHVREMIFKCCFV